MNYMDEEDDQEKLIDNGVGQLAVAPKDTDFDYSKAGYDSALNENKDRSSGLGWAQFAAGIGDALQGKSPSNSAAIFDNYRKNIKNDTVGKWEAKKKLEASDPNSQKSVAFRKSVESTFPDIAKKYGDQWNQMSASDQSTILPFLQLKENTDARKESARLMGQTREEARADRLLQQKIINEDRARKAKELSSTEAKQMSLYKSGDIAEKQYQDAVKEGSSYDPTQSGQFIDNSSWAPNWMKDDKAIEAQSAQDAWIESFLRDASGAAIAPSERSAYAKTYFAQPGDSKQVVADKAERRKIKSDSALIGTGPGQEMVAKQQSRQPQQKQIIKKQVNQKTGEVRVVYSDGSVEVQKNVAGN